jgi:hypothetical protein
VLSVETAFVGVMVEGEEGKVRDVLVESAAKLQDQAVPVVIVSFQSQPEAVTMAVRAVLVAAEDILVVAEAVLMAAEVVLMAAEAVLMAAETAFEDVCARHLFSC